ncbi:MAG: GDP-mannose 4,6-dehydratase [Acidobacteriota bacterium]|nr:GDP-mannose 4,6-dehydratase [Acidobacteriota bacterium]MDH3525334.1 GDP-mannose 4,6-dehydratase [Acidobacteriota bacterium]
MRVLVTGVGGFVGSNLAADLAARGVEVWGTFLADAPALPGVELLDVDIVDREAVAGAVATSDPDVIVHLAGLSHVGASWNELAAYFRVNVLGGENVLAAAGERRVVVASSAEVYGVVPADAQPIGEDAPLAPASPYALTKAALERIARPRGAIVVRSFNAIGAGQAPDFALPAFARQLAAIRKGVQEPVLEVGNLAARRDFIPVGDVVTAYETLLSHGEPGAAYNLGSGRALSIEQALRRLIAVSGVEAAIEVDPARFRPVDVPLLQADASRLRALGWAPRGDLDEALRALWESVS